jgi:methylenetetrahydrofolate reductase (NADPH)
MTAPPSPAVTSPADLLRGLSIEITGRDAEQLPAAAAVVPAGTRVNITFLQNESSATRVDAARRVRGEGLVPVPHISARRLASQRELEELLAALADVDAQSEVFVVAGDRDRPAGPFADSLSLIESGLLEKHGVSSVGVAGYPEGHPQIDGETLRESLRLKVQAIVERRLAPSLSTQFGFDAAAVLEWLRTLRQEGVTCPVRIGVPGPAGVRRLLGFARRFGIRSSAGVAQKYGFSITNLLGTAGPDRFVEDLVDGLVPSAHGAFGLHFYTFGDVESTVRWIRAAQERSA